MNFWHLLEQHQLASGLLETINNYLRNKGLSLRHGTIFDATIIHAPGSTKIKEGKRDPEMHQTKNGHQYFFGMKAHIGADAESGLVHGAEHVVCADAGYTGVEKRPEHEGRPMIWQVAARSSTYEHLSKRSVRYKTRRKIEKVKAQVKHPFRVTKRQFGYLKTLFRGLAKNTGKLTTLFALSNLWMVRRQVLPGAEEVHP